MRRSRLVCLLVVMGLIALAPSGPALSSEASGSVSSVPQATAGNPAALWYPPYNPEKNYCGPEWLQESGYGWVVPRDPIPGFDFSPACYVHDACYSECCQNGMSQADCDEQFLANMGDICSATRDELLAGCSGFSYLGCLASTLARYVLCINMAGTYASAVSYLGDGVIETQSLALLLAPLGVVGVATALAIATFAGDIQIEAAYSCPCRCITCPPDESLGAPICASTASQGAFVTQDFMRYHKEETNVSGQGTVCECVGAQEAVVTPCPAGSTCAPDGRVCGTDICDPATCNEEALVGHCEQHGFSLLGLDIDLFGTLLFEWTVSACRAVDDYRSECATTTETLLSTYCPSGCGPDGVSCAASQHSSLRLRVMEPTSGAEETYVPCAACRIQLEGISETFEGTTAIDGTVILQAVPAGIYLARYGCGPDRLGSHRPSDLVLYPSEPVSWVTAQGTSPSPTEDLPAVVAPASGVVDVLTGFCGPAPVCSASEMWPLTITTQNLPTAVLTTRHEILEAALTCDYETLGELASWGGFSYLGGEMGTNPAAYWQSLEESGEGEPLRDMVVALLLPVEGAGTGGTQDTYYLWSDGAGGATEYRLGIADDGRWLFFLADD